MRPRKTCWEGQGRSEVQLEKAWTTTEIPQETAAAEPAGLAALGVVEQESPCAGLGRLAEVERLAPGKRVGR